MTRVLYPGSFDPFHNGHLTLVETAARLFDEVVVAAVRNPQKSGAWFSLEERQAMLTESLAHLPNVEIIQFSRLVVDLARDVGADLIVKGLRAASDFEAELQMAQMNYSVGRIHTVFLPCSPEYSFVASRWIREMARFGGDITHLVPPPVAERVRAKIAAAGGA